MLIVALNACGAARLDPVECDPGERVPSPRLECLAAVETARGALRQPHPAITRIQFLYGSRSLAMARRQRPPGSGYVVFTFADGRHQTVHVDVGRDGPVLAP